MDWDTALFYAVNGWAGQSSALDWLMLQCSSARNFIVLVVAYLAYRAWLDWRHGMLVTSVLGVLIGAGDFIGAQIKLWLARPRPCQVLLNVHELTGCGGLFSLPSNHAVNAATDCSLCLGCCSPRPDGPWGPFWYSVAYPAFILVHIIQRTCSRDGVSAVYWA